MGKPIEFYLSKGFDEKTAKYYANGRRTILSVIPNDDFTLTIEFDNSEKRIFDVKPLFEIGTVFKPFMKWDNFKRVYLDEFKCIAWDIDPNIDSNIEWNNKVDLSPDSCYLDSVPAEKQH